MFDDGAGNRIPMNVTSALAGETLQHKRFKASATHDRPQNISVIMASNINGLTLVQDSHKRPRKKVRFTLPDDAAEE